MSSVGFRDEADGWVVTGSESSSLYTEIWICNLNRKGSMPTMGFISQCAIAQTIEPASETTCDKKRRWKGPNNDKIFHTIVAFRCPQCAGDTHQDKIAMIANRFMLGRCEELGSAGTLPRPARNERNRV